ncbi:Hypothetical protein GLP15_773 [Giardia lamblia P15]|uniref:DOP1 N-terminal domain-containing protein n=1 Tax=Giardia intestinalis (strain P15) TaxID=658858 RepID=E1EXY0_GIAIA|nr:Hypothetical protein GLP15_773 [Giardia lamblia P15]
MPKAAIGLTNSILNMLNQVDNTAKDWSDCARAFQKTLELVQRADQFDELYSPVAVSQKLSCGLLPHLQTGVHTCCMEIIQLLLMLQSPDGLNRTAHVLLQPLLDFMPLSKIQTREALLNIIQAVYEKMDKKAFSSMFFSIIISFCSMQIVETDPLSARMLDLVILWMREPLCCKAIMSAILNVIALEQATTLERTNAFLFLSRYLSKEDASSPIPDQSCPPNPQPPMCYSIDLVRLKATAARLLLANSDMMLVKALFDILPRLLHIDSLLYDPSAYSIEYLSDPSVMCDTNHDKLEELCSNYVFFFACTIHLNISDAGVRTRCHKYLIDEVPDCLLSCYAYNALLFFCYAERYLTTIDTGSSDTLTALTTFIPLRLTGVLQLLTPLLQETTIISSIYIDALMCVLPYILTVSPYSNLGAAFTGLFTATSNITVMLYRSLCVTSSHGWPLLKLEFTTDKPDESNTDNLIVHPVGSIYACVTFTRRHTDLQFAQRLEVYLSYLPRLIASVQAPLELTHPVLDTLGDRIYNVGSNLAMVAVELVASFFFSGASLLLDGLVTQSSLDCSKDIFVLANKLLVTCTEPTTRHFLWILLTENQYWTQPHNVLFKQYNDLLQRVKDAISILIPNFQKDNWQTKVDPTPIDMLYLLLYVVCLKILETKSENKNTLLEIVAAHCSFGNAAFITSDFNSAHRLYFLLHIHLLFFGLFQDFEQFSPLIINFVTSLPKDNHERLLLLRSAFFGSSDINYTILSIAPIDGVEQPQITVDGFNDTFLSLYLDFTGLLFLSHPRLFDLPGLGKSAQHVESASSAMEVRFKQLSLCRPTQLIFNICESIYSQIDSLSPVAEGVLVFLSTLLSCQQLPGLAEEYSIHLMEELRQPCGAALVLMYDILQRCIEMHSIPNAFDTLIYEIVGAMARQDAVDTQSSYFKIISLLVDTLDGSLYLLNAAFRLSETRFNLNVDLEKTDGLTHLSMQSNSPVDVDRLVFSLQSFTHIILIFGYRFIANLTIGKLSVCLLNPSLTRSFLCMDKSIDCPDSPLEALLDLLIVLLLEHKVFLATQRPPSEGDMLLPARMIALKCLNCLINAMLEGASSDPQLNNHLIRMINKLSYVFWQQVSGLIRHSDTLSPLLTDVFIYLLNASFDVFSHMCASGRAIYDTSYRITLFLVRYFQVLSSPQQTFFSFMQRNPRLVSATLATFEKLNVLYQITAAEASQFINMSPTSDLPSDLLGIPGTPLQQLLLEYKYIIEVAPFHSTIKESTNTLTEDWDKSFKEILANGPDGPIKKTGTDKRAFLPAPCRFQPLCLFAWFLLYGILNDYVLDSNLLSYLSSVVRILVFYSYRKTLQTPGIPALAFETQAKHINREIVTPFSGDFQIIYTYPRLLRVALRLCLKNSANTKAIFDRVLKPLLSYNSYHYALGCLLITRKEKLHYIYYFLVKPFLDTGCDNVLSAPDNPSCDTTRLSAQSLLLAFFSVQDLIYNLQTRSYPEVNQVVNRPLRELLVSFSRMNSHDALDLFMVAFQSETMGTIAVGSTPLVSRYVIDLITVLLFTTQTLSDCNATLLPGITRLTKSTFGVEFGAPGGFLADTVFTAQMNSAASSSTMTMNATNTGLRLPKILKVVSSTNEHSLFSISAYMSLDYLLALARCISLTHSILAYCQSKTTFLADGKVLQSIKDILVERTKFIIELLLKKLTDGTRIKSPNSVLDHIALIVLAGAGSMDVLDILQMEPSVMAVARQLTHVSTPTDKQTGTKLTSTVCHQILFLLKELNFFKNPRKVSTGVADFAMHVVQLLAHLSFASDSQLIADIIVQITVAPEVLQILLQGTAFISLAQIMGHSTALTLEGVADKLAKSAVSKKLSIVQCKKIVATVTSTELADMIDLLGNKDKDNFIISVSRVSEDMVKSFVLAKIIYHFPDTHQAKEVLIKYCTELLGTLQTYLDSFFNQTKEYLPDTAILSARSGKGASEMASSQIVLRAGICKLYGKLFLINACIAHVPLEMSAEVHSLILSLGTALNFAVKVVSSARTSNHSGKNTTGSVGKFLPTRRIVNGTIALIQSTLSERFKRISRSVSILDSSTEKLDLPDTIYDALNQACMLLCT